MVEIIYSTQRRGFEPGRVYENPKFFSGVNRLCTRAIVIGDWPEVVKAYEEIGVEVVASFLGQKTPAPKPVAPKLETSENLEDLEKLGIQELRERVARIDPDKKIISKKEGIAFIQAHETPQNATEPPVDGDDEETEEELL